MDYRECMCSAWHWLQCAEDTRMGWEFREMCLKLYHRRLANAIGWASR